MLKDFGLISVFDLDVYSLHPRYTYINIIHLYHNANLYEA